MKKLDIIYFLWGALFGLLSPFVGLFVGAQILPVLGTILMFPIVLISQIVDKPFGEFTITQIILSISFSVIVWGVLFVLVGRFKSLIS